MKRVFLLGGKDLEMQEIKNILKLQGEIFEDKNLSWKDANLSAYKDLLNDKDLFIGIELQEDIKLPKNYHKIDHHGKNSDRLPSSIEQIAELLDIKLNRFQQLVAQNDKAYIEGMKSIDATDEEIQMIRQKDREVQGVTKEDEKKAQKSVDEAKDNYIYSYTSHFSAVSDRVYEKFSNYVIYSNEEIVFYRYKNSYIKEFLKQKCIPEDFYYEGGGECGYVGIKEKKLTKEQIEELLYSFKKSQKHKNPIYSYHTFMFPFSFDFAKKKNPKENEKLSFNERVKIDDKFNEALENEGWIYKAFEVEKNTRNYNEYVYFFEFARDVIYNTKKFEKGRSVYFYEKEYKNSFITLKVKCEKKYKLILDGISLRVYDTGVAILSLDVLNDSYSKFDDVLIINDYLRRTYPQFLSNENKLYTFETKKAFLPDLVEIDLNGKIITENFEDDYKCKIPDEPKISNIIQKILGEDIFSVKYKPKKYHIKPIVDDRMFVISWFGHNGLSNKLKKWDFEKQKYAYEDSEEWYKYIFIDSSFTTVQSKHMKKDLIKDSTYDRWVELGTLYGITRYSFVCISENSDFTKYTLPLPHMQTMYYQMMHLILAQRASILRFSDEVSYLSSLIKEDGDLATKTGEVYKHYIKFINKLYIRDITAQDQGIEIYRQAQRIFNIHHEVKDLDSEIEELHNYIEIKEEKDRSDRLEKISQLGAVFLPPSLLTGYLGVNSIDFTKDICWFSITIFSIGLSAFLGYKMIKNPKKYAISLLILFVLIFLFSYLDVENKQDKQNNDTNQSKGAICQVLK